MKLEIGIRIKQETEKKINQTCNPIKTDAYNPETKICKTFLTTCIPEGWILKDCEWPSKDLTCKERCKKLLYNYSICRPHSRFGGECGSRYKADIGESADCKNGLYPDRCCCSNLLINEVEDCVEYEKDNIKERGCIVKAGYIVIKLKKNIATETEIKNILNSYNLNFELINATYTRLIENQVKFYYNNTPEWFNITVPINLEINWTCKILVEKNLSVEYEKKCPEPQLGGV